MDKRVKRIGVLTSGGDAPGMNAAIRAVVLTAQHLRIDCIGIRRGYNGLICGDMVPLAAEDVNGIERWGGTILYTARSPDFMTEAGLRRAAENCRFRGLDGLVIIGGDGSFKGALELSKLGIPVIGIPGTIDNDIGCTTYTIGFDTACNTATDAVDKLEDTMQSHERCSVVEVMGHRSGHLALNVGISVGATVTIIPRWRLILRRMSRTGYEWPALKGIPILLSLSRKERRRRILLRRKSDKQLELKPASQRWVIPARRFASCTDRVTAAHGV